MGRQRKNVCTQCINVNPLLSEHLRHVTMKHRTMQMSYGGKFSNWLDYASFIVCALYRDNKRFVVHKRPGCIGIDASLPVNRDVTYRKAFIG
jgi:hypothetical protein